MEEPSIPEMEATIEQVKTVWLKQIKDRDPNCDTSNLEAELAKAEEFVKEKKSGFFLMQQGDYTVTGIWDKLTVDGSVEYGRETNTQSFTLEGSLGQLEGTMSSPAGEENSEYFVFEIKNFGNGVIIPSPDADGNIEFYQFAVLNGEDILAMAFLSNNLDRNGLEKLADRRAKKNVEEANLDPFIKNNLGKILVSTEGPIFINGRENGQTGAAEVKLTTSLTLGQPIWFRTVMENNRTPMELLKLTGYPPVDKIGAAIRTKILFDGEEVGQDFFRCTKAEDVKIVNEATSYQEVGFKPNGPAQDAYREGFEGIASKNPKIGEHTLEIQKWAVNYNIVDPESENKFPLEVLMATSGKLQLKITENSWEPFCNSGENNYGPTSGVINSYSKSILALAKKEAVRSNWKETPFSCRYVGKYEKYHEVTGVHMYTVYKGAVKSRMPNGSIVEQIILMANGAFYGVGSNTHRYLPPNCN
ncbi:hypothetical protein [Flagellimonas flava]|uniref:hypothetical protein n=1 Tax=Flagellimonas flava TaxID=570519 RepID=UPI003D65DBBB